MDIPVKDSVGKSRSLLPKRPNFLIPGIFLALLVLIVAPVVKTRMHRVAAPPFQAHLITGQPVSLTGLRGHIVFLEFMATWCDECRQDVPVIAAFVHAHPGVTWLTVDTGEPDSVVRAFADAHQTQNVISDATQHIAKLYGIVGYPTIIAIDAHGDRRKMWQGFLPDTPAELDQAARML